MLEAQLVLTTAQVLAAQEVELGRTHRALELRSRDDLAEERVGVEQHVVVEEDVVDADDALFAQFHVVGLVRALVHGQPEAEVRIVVEIGTRGHDPVHEAGFHERDDRAHAEARGRERTGDAERHRHVFLQHALGQQPGALAQSRAVVCEKRVVDEVGNGLAAGDGGRIDALAAEVAVGLASCGHDGPRVS